MVRSAIVSLLLAVAVLGLPAPALAASTIDVWYGLNQDLALPGEPQVWFNIPGNVSGATSLSYRLNGGPSVTLTIGPDGRRLHNTGDFNVDLAVSSLNSGANTVVITANDGTTATVTVNYTPPSGIWPLPSTIDWSDYSAGCVVGQPCGNINDAAHVVDGKWQLTAAGVRTLDPGYDRAIAVGDIDWTEYEVSAPVTIHALNQDTNQGIPGAVGFLVGWQGHTNNPVACGQPRCGWLPVGAIGYHRTNQVLQLWDSGTLASTPKTLTVGETYVFKLRVEDSPNANPGNLFSFKVWDINDPEPAGWDISGQETESGVPHNGSVLLLSHWDDVTFGDVSICPLTGCAPAPPVAVDDSRQVSDLGSVEIDVLSNDIPVSFPLDPATVVVSNESNGTTSVDPVTGVVTFTHTQTGATPGTFNYTVQDTGGGVSNQALVTVDVVAPVFESDDFNAPTLDPRWTWLEVDAGTSYQLVGAGTGDAHLAISTGATPHNQYLPPPGGTAGEAPRVMQAVTADSDFEVEVGFNAEPAGSSNNQGILIVQDAARWLRFDIYHDGSQLKAFIGDTNGNTVAKLNQVIPAGSARILRVRRVGNDFTFEHSADGSTWSTAGAMSSTLTVQSIGVFAANPTGGNYTAEVDYFFSTAAPISPEDPATLISGIVFEDENANQVLDGSEGGIGGVKVTLRSAGPDGILGGSGAADDTSSSQTTPADGTYSFTGLDAGPHKVSVKESTVPAGLVSSTGNNPTVVDLAAAEQATVQFGYADPAGLSSISGIVFEDENGNQVLDGAEGGIGGVKVTLRSAGPDGVLGGSGAADDVFTSLTTPADGTYSFAGLDVGSHKVSVKEATVPAGLTSSTGNNPTLVDLALGEQATVQFGYADPAVVTSISGIVFEDENANQVFDGADTGIAAVKVMLRAAGPDGVLGGSGAADDVFSSRRTAADGSYSFAGLDAGPHKVSVRESTVPAGLTLSTANNPTILNLAAGEQAIVQFGYQ